MSYINESLSKDEKIEQLFDHHWSAKIPIFLWAILGLPFLIGPFIAIWHWLNLKNTEYGVTNKRAIHKKGIISRNSDEMKLTSIETVEIKQGIWGRIFGAGDVVITGRGISDVIFKGIDNPMEVKRTIESVEPV